MKRSFSRVSALVLLLGPALTVQGSLKADSRLLVNNATPIPCGQTLVDTIASPAQVDTFTFDGTVNEAVVISAVGTSGSLCAQAQLYSPTGVFLGQNACNGHTASLVLPSTGTYTILIYDSGKNNTGTYGVSLQFTTDRCGTALACGETKTGNITNQAQLDGYTFNCTANIAVAISAIGTSGNVCAQAQLYSPTGVFLGQNACNGHTASLVLPDSGKYTILIYDSGKDNVGNYQIALSCTCTAVEIASSDLPLVFVLGQNYPNPFNPETTITFSLPGSNHVTLKIFDLAGREITTLIDKNLPAGRYEVVWDANNLVSGVYFCQLQAGKSLAIKKLALVR